MANNLFGVSSYQNNTKAWESATSANKLAQAVKEKNTSAASNSGNKKISAWKSISSTGSLVPLEHEEYGMTIGNAKLSDEGKEYYNKLKEKFHGMDFILVSKDTKEQVEKNALSYGNSSKPVVLICEEEVEKMATDADFRKQYEGIIESSQAKLLEAKNSLASTGANIKNFGISVGDNGKMSFFATVEKNGKEMAVAQKERIEKKREQKAAEKKKADKEAAAERIENRKAKNAAEEERISSEGEETGFEDDKEYLQFSANSLEELLNMVSAYAYEASSDSIITTQESMVGQNIDFKG